MAQPKNIVVTNWVHAEVIDYLSRFGRVKANPNREPWPAHELLGRAQDAHALLAFMPDRVDQAFLDRCPELRIVACALKGADNFDVAACTERGIYVTVVPDLLTAPTAELALGLMIALGRNVIQGHDLVRAGRFRGWRPTLYGRGLDGSVVGILGMGAVGRAIAQRLGAFRCALAYHDQRALPPRQEAELGLCRVEFGDLLARSDYLVLAVPLTQRTLHIIEAEALARMKPGALLINPARGSVVDEDAVLASLQSGHLGGYAADVFEMEDWARQDRPAAIDPRLYAHPRTVLTPHLGSAVEQVRRDIAMSAASEIVACFKGERPPGAVNEAVLAPAAA